MKKNFELKKKEIKTNKPYYELYITMDYCDGDYISKKIKVDKKKFEDDELYLLVLAYIDNSKYGSHIDEDKNFNWINEYLGDNDLMLYGEFDQCHSYEGLEIKLYEGGNVYCVELPSIKDIFDSEEEMIEYMNNLYEKKN